MARSASNITPFAANEENQLSNIFRLQDDRDKQSLSEIFSKGYEKKRVEEAAADDRGYNNRVR
jgi:hypothetical protein